MANDIIDIDVFQTVENVEITVEPNLTTVNINEVQPSYIYIHDFTSLPAQQTFLIPSNYNIRAVFLNRTLLIQSEYTFTGGILTILETLETGTIISTR